MGNHDGANWAEILVPVDDDDDVDGWMGVTRKPSMSSGGEVLEEEEEVGLHRLEAGERIKTRTESLLTFSAIAVP